jgi:signal transduction histidine kinase
MRVTDLSAKLVQANARWHSEAERSEKAERERCALLARLVSVQEEERRQIARELHDRMGPNLAAFAQELKALSDAGPEYERMAPVLERLRSVATELGKQTHHLALELRPAALDDLGLETALSNYIEEWSERTGFQAHFHAAGGDPGLRLPPDIETALYRVAQEALSNIARHAVGATQVSVLLSRDDERTQRQAPLVRLIVTEDGPGFDPRQEEHDPAPEEGKPWRGLTGIRERLELLSGTLDIESEPGEGTTLFASVPLPPGQPSAESEDPPLSGGYIAVSPRAA